MNVKAFVLVALLIAGGFSAPLGSYGSVNEAFKDTFMHFGDLGSLGESLLKIDTTNFMFTVSKDGLASRLVAQGIHASLADLLVAQTKVDMNDTYVRKTGIQTFKTEQGNVQVAACAYRTAKDNKLDYVCLAAQAKCNKTNFVSVFTSIKIRLMRRLTVLFDRFRKYHAFSANGFKVMKALGSAETQNKLTQFLEASNQGKQSAYTALYEKKDDPFMVKLFKNGITYYSSSASIESLEGVEKPMLGEYFNHLITSLAIPADTQEEFRNEMKLATFGDKSDWTSIDFVFKNSRGTAKYINAMCATDPNTKESDFLIADVKSSFELGPDIIVTTRTKSALFGLIKWTSVKIVKRPAEITEEMIKALFNFFKLAAFEKFIAFRKGTMSK